MCYNVGNEYQNIWGEEIVRKLVSEIVRKLVDENDVLSRLQETPQEIKEVNHIIDVLSEALSQNFLKELLQVLRESLKKDFGNGGEAYAGFTIDMFGMLNQGIQEILLKLNDLENSCKTNISTTENHKNLIEILQKSYGKTKGNQDDLVNIINQAQTDLNQQFNNVKQQLERLQVNKIEAFKALGNSLELGFKNIEKSLNNLDDKVDNLVEEVKGLRRVQERQKQTNTATIRETEHPLKLIPDNEWQGRKTEISKLENWLIKRKPIIGINGAGGIGKSSLAGRLYEAFIMSSSHKKGDFIDGFPTDVSSKTLFSNLATDIIAKFGGAIPEQETQSVNALISCLQSGQYLLLVDNLESVLTPQREWQNEFYAQFFNTWLECGKNSTVLITAREKPLLNGIEWIDLEGLEVKEGAKFLQELGITGDLEDFSALVGGHPLMLRLVADFLKEECPQDPDLGKLDSLGLGNLRQMLTHERVTGSHRKEIVGMVAILSATLTLS